MAYTTINKSTDYFNTKLWTGTGANLSITGVGHRPDFTWIKNRANTDDHNLFDVLRGFSTDALLRSNTSGAATDTTEGIKSFDSDGFSLGTNGSSNGNGQGMVSWNWKANGSGSANTDGSQSATVSVNTTAGFSIVKFVNNQSYTTNTFGHGLGVVPKVIIMRSLDSAYNWDVHHHKIAISKRLVLNSAAAEANSTYMNSTSPTNQVFTVKSDEFDTNDNCIAYCFAEKTGYSKFGSWQGNSNADGPFIFCGFKPSFVLWKNSETGESWGMVDNKRDVDNVVRQMNNANTNNAESTQTNIMDFVSNGFKIRWHDGNINGTNQKHIFMAFAEAPLVGTNNVPCTAR